ncbi:MAG: CoA pyrophosphatase [Ignavibacteriaceae bacterium]
MKKKDLKKLIKNLPEIPGIMNKQRFFNSAVLVALVELNGEYNFLFEKRSAHIRQGGEICFPGGEHNPGEDSSLKFTAIRETSEELGISKNKIVILGELDTFVGPMGVIVAPFLGIIKIDNLNKLKTDNKEVEKVFILPVSYFEENNPEVYKVNFRVEPSFKDTAGREFKSLPAEQLGIPARYSNPGRNYSYEMIFWRSSYGTIWGITAEIISHVINLPDK